MINAKSLLFALASIAASQVAFAGAENCKDVDIHVDNQLSDNVKVVDIEYYDSTKRGTNWRKENGVAAKVVNHGDSKKVYTRNLEEVLNDSKMKVKVKYKRDNGRGWDKGVWSRASEAKTCVKGAKYTVVLGS